MLYNKGFFDEYTSLKKYEEMTRVDADNILKKFLNVAFV
jgi:hypothetical protein